MASVTTDDLLRELTTACQFASCVESFSVETSDEDILGVRVFLRDNTFINAFYNIATGKVAFAWIKEGKRLYGKDNTKMGWHVHSFGNPSAHKPCEQTDFEHFLHEVDEHLRK